MQVPAMFYGTYAEVRKRCRTALMRIGQGQQPALDMFEGEGMLDTAKHPGMIVVEGPGITVSACVHFHCYVPWQILMEEEPGGGIGSGLREPVFATLLKRPWGLPACSPTTAWAPGSPSRNLIAIGATSGRRCGTGASWMLKAVATRGNPVLDSRFGRLHYLFARHWCAWAYRWRYCVRVHDASWGPACAASTR